MKNALGGLPYVLGFIVFVILQGFVEKGYESVVIWQYVTGGLILSYFVWTIINSRK